jgi:hypothetical protein
VLGDLIKVVSLVFGNPGPVLSSTWKNIPVLLLIAAADHDILS